MECKFCGRELEDDAVYCFYCGKRLDGKKPCPSCKALLPEDAIFCGKCGTRVVPEILKDVDVSEKPDEEQEIPPSEESKDGQDAASGHNEADESVQEAENGQPADAEENGGGQISEINEEVTPSFVAETDSVSQEDVCAQDTPEKAAKWKNAVEITKLCLAGFAALIGFIFTFCIGVTVTGKTELNVSLYDFFGNVYANLDRIIIMNDLGDTQSFALYLPYIFGTLVSVAALICNLVFSIMTVVALVRQYAFKNRKVNFVRHAFRTFISYMIFASVFYALKVVPLEVMTGNVRFNGATVAALIMGGIAAGGYFVCCGVLRLNDFKDKNEIITGGVAAGTCVAGIISAILLTLTVCRFSNAEASNSQSFMEMVLNSAFSLSDGTNCGGVMCFAIPSFAVQIALFVLTVCLIFSNALRVGTGSCSDKKSLGFAIAAAVLSLLYFLGAFAAANMLDSEITSGVSRSYGIPITVIVMTFIALGGTIAAIILDKKFKRVG